MEKTTGWKVEICLGLNNYRQRQQIIEHQFGNIKRHWHFDYTLTKGKEKVLGEVYLIFTA